MRVEELYNLVLIFSLQQPKAKEHEKNSYTGNSKNEHGHEFLKRHK
jgi:hypothetical protein